MQGFIFNNCPIYFLEEAANISFPSALLLKVMASLELRDDRYFFENTHHLFFYFPRFQIIEGLYTCFAHFLPKWHSWTSVDSTPVSSILLISFLPRQRRSLGRVCHRMCNNSFVRWNCIIFLIEGTDNGP